MKKIISIALSVVMLIAVAMPVFAAAGTVTIDEKTSATPKTADVVVKTVLGGGMPATGTYAVTIPADLTIAWDTVTATDVSYSVTSQLALGATLKVGIASLNASTLKEVKSNKTIAYTPANFADKTFNEINNAVSSASTITVEQAAWDAAPVAEYLDTLTYTVTYVAAP
ncbi:MAG: hypothetical protein RR229_00700 [Oscillospiraceae bacterium]